MAEIKEGLRQELLELQNTLEMRYKDTNGTLEWPTAKKINKLIDVISSLEAHFYDHEPEKLAYELRRVGFIETDRYADRVKDGEFND